MPTQRRLLLYQLLASLIAIGYALSNPPWCVEEHLRSLEALDDLVLFYFVLGGYTSLAFSFFHWGIRSLVIPCVIGSFHASLTAFNVPLILVCLSSDLSRLTSKAYIDRLNPDNMLSTTTSTRTISVVHVPPLI